MQNYLLPELAIYILWNLAGFILVMIDKQRSRRNEWRIRERTFFWFAVAFGAAGILLGMHIFRHKTRHLSFKIGIPLLCVLNVISIYLVAAWLS